MVKTLRRKFVLTSMGALTLILAVLVGTLNLTNYIRVQRNADDLLRILAENGGSFPGESFFGTREEEAPPERPEGSGALQPGRPQESTVPPADNPGGDNPPGGLRGGRQTRGRLFRDNAIFGYNRTAETPFETRWFWVRISGTAKVLETNVAHIATIDANAAAAMAQAVFAGETRDTYLKEGGARGTYGGYRFVVSGAGDGALLVFLDRQSEYHNIRLLLVVSLIISAAVLLFMLLLVTLLSSRAVAPTVEAFEKQKRFVSDASHELKTPLSVISADVDVLEMTGEKSEWTASIRDQVARMNQLIRDMLTLSRMEDEKLRVVFSDVDFSAVAAKAAQPFFVVAKAAGKTFETGIAEGVHLRGDADALAQLISILLDNAMKYSEENGSVQLKLEKEPRGGTRLEAANTCERLPEGNLDRLFDRFWRADTSRSRGTGGFGIGLSVARAIVESHGGKIGAERDGDRIIRFIAAFPAQTKA